MDMKLYAVFNKAFLKNENFQRLLRLVSQRKKERIFRYRSPEDAQRTLLGDMLIRFAVSAETGTAMDRIDISEEDGGKPFLCFPSGLYFNLSHSGRWIVCVTDRSPVGVDIEKENGITSEAMRESLSSREWMTLAGEEECVRRHCFYRLWTQKECYAKAQGKGLRLSFQSLEMRETTGGFISPVLDGRPVLDFYLKSFEHIKGYALAACGMRACFPEEINVLDIKEICSRGQM